MCAEFYQDCGERFSLSTAFNCSMAGTKVIILNLIDKSGLVLYNTNMERPSDINFFIPFQAAYSLLQDAANRDRTTARRTALVEILWQERYLERESLMSRVEDRLGVGCFGDSAWEDTFNRDMQAVKDAFALAGLELGYSRTKTLAGYYLRNEERLLPHLRQAIAHSINEIDLRQLGIYRNLGLVQRVRQALKASEQARWEARYARGVKKTAASDCTLAQFIQNMIRGLETAGIVYAAGGSAAGWVWGEPHPTQQLDLVLNLRSGQTGLLMEHLHSMGLILAGELPTGKPAPIRRITYIHAVHPGSHLRVNLVIPQPDDEFFHSAMRQAVRLDFGREIGMLYVLSAEYLVLQSLLDYGMHREPDHLRHIAAVLIHQQKNLDRRPIGLQAGKRGWMRVWEEITEQADKKQP